MEKAREGKAPQTRAERDFQSHEMRVDKSPPPPRSPPNQRRITTTTERMIENRKKAQEEIRGIVTAISVEGRAMGVQLAPLSVQKPEAVIFGSSAARESLSHILVLGNVTPSMAEMTGLDRASLMPVPSGAVGAGTLLTNGTKQTPVQVPIVRNMEQLQRVLIHATTN